ncbi:MAG: TerB family tellurite resistance protein [Pseudohongiella sp.]|uniref:TerB family tellurite resistance protein n=1 Tax=Pseudohongiella sp. TaxID=1979412 RepID=UPI0034A03BB7
MSSVNFESITSLLQGSDTDHTSKQLLKEVLVLVLARAIRADTNVEPAEVSMVQSILSDVLGEPIDAADIKLAASSELFERQSLDRYLKKATRKLNEEDRILVMQCLIQVLRSDDHIREFELDYFDRIANALKATPSEIAGLRAGPVA